MILVVSTLLALTRLCCAAESQADSAQQVSVQSDYFNWTKVHPSTSLRWRKCYESYECARLEVPLDWTNSSNVNKVILALTRVPAVVDHKDPSFGGTVLVNPGGPSGSGVDVMRWQGYGIREIVDSEKHFEILSWDPRGVQHTTPSVACFGDNWHRETWTFKNWAVGLLDSSESAFDVKWAASESFGQLCNSTKIGVFPDGSNIRKFVSTASTARDMVAIIDALEEEKNEEAGLWHGAEQQPIQEHAKKPALLNYWGYSYGTYLGNTFASMFPERIGRMILDGNVDPVDYSRTRWLTNLFDNNKTLDWFFQFCFEAGSKCAFNDGKASKVADLKSKMWTLLDRLKHDPVPAVYQETADIVSYADLARLIHSSLYSPRYDWPDLAQVAADLHERNATSMIKHLQHLELPENPKVCEYNLNKQNDDGNNNKTRAGPPSYPHQMEAAHCILCGDGDAITQMTKDEWKVRLDTLKDQSSIVGPMWAEISFICQHWPDSLRPSERNRFVGPFKSKLEDYDSRASPLLFIGNTADPVTPLRNAFKNSAAHEGSVVLTQNSPGHCTGYVNPSECTFRVVKDFFSKGELPKEGTVCEGFDNPFES